MRYVLGVLAIAVLAVGISLYWVSRPTPVPATPPPPIPTSVLDQLPKERKGQVLIYGAYGFTGKGISELASEYGITPVLAGRNASKLKPLADSLGYDYVVLPLENNHDNLVKVLKHFEIVLHIAGPYTYTAKPMLDAVVEAGTHYVDLTGENHVIQAELDRDEEFKRANIMVMPAVGYDVVPTDCLNVYVADKISQPTQLTVVLNGSYTAAEGAQASRGTMKSGLEMLGRPLLKRENGEMVAMATPELIHREENGRKQTLLQIPWADMITSYISTGIPNIEVFQVQEGELPPWLLGVAQSDAGRRLLGWLIDNFAPEGPPPGAQENRQTRIVSTVSNEAGATASAALITPEAYLLTFHSTLIIARRVIDGEWEPGFQTVGKVYGPDLVLEVPGVSRTDL
ncbi:saccharopine dehydrogenase family protein [Halioglobus sp. Uisw_031]|uniref:saccharopine dehydrogenase family protein n=1 Tax=Halioglobus sp. Uisw_031 TaxID=3230977 RepID=UPI0039EAE80F